MSGLACLPCGKFFRVKKQGVALEEGMPLGPPALDGTYATWTSCKLWMADLCECPSCGAQVLTGFGHRPIIEHYMPRYAEVVERLQPITRIDDCGGKRP